MRLIPSAVACRKKRVAHRVRNQAERARRDMLIRRTNTKRAFAGDDVDPLVGIIVRVIQPRFAKLMQ